MKRCLHCNIEISTTSKHYSRKKFCSSSCAGKSYKLNHNIKSSTHDLCRGTAGTVQELIVTVDLLKKGFEVFRSVSPSCSCDLAIVKNKQMLRIEVTTGYVSSKSGHICFPKKDFSKFDVLAIVVNDVIKYQPTTF